MKKKKAQTVRSSHPEEIKEILSPDMGSVQKCGADEFGSQFDEK